MTATPADPRTIGILLFDGFEELDAVGPWEVLAAWTLAHPEDGYRVVTVAAGEALEVTAAKGLRVTADCRRADAPPLDVLLVPGGHGTRRLVADPAFLGWVGERRAEAALLASVCTGALVYAAAGLLGGRPATTHWSAFDELAGLEPAVVARPGARWVDDGDLVTAAGVSAGIDLALHLVDRLAGTDRAREVRREIQYDPEPPV